MIDNVICRKKHASVQHLSDLSLGWSVVEVASRVGQDKTKKNKKQQSDGK